MVCQAIRLAALSAVFALGAWATVSAQNLDAGKSPAQIFSSTCAACHSTPRGLLKSVGPGQLPAFLRQHYTTGQDMAGMLAGYLMQSGAAQRVETPAKASTPKGGGRPPADIPGQEAATEPAPKAGKKGKAADRRGKQVAPAETRREDAKPAEKPTEGPPAAETAAPAPTAPAPASPADMAPTAPELTPPPPPSAPAVGPDGEPRMPDLPEPPPLTPDLMAPPAPAQIPPPQPPL